jgi:hypothetical protein
MVIRISNIIELQIYTVHEAIICVPIMLFLAPVINSMSCRVDRRTYGEKKFQNHSHVTFLFAPGGKSLSFYR